MTHEPVGDDHLLHVNQLARVEGEGAMHVRTKDGAVTDVRLQIYEPPRFFESFLRGRSYTEPPDITARICGICPVAYQMSACLAMEDACGVTIPEPIAELRRLLYCGEWIESHALHIYLLHAPDFLGYDDAMQMAADDRNAVERGLELKKIGNRILESLGGRAIHPVNVRVGGFYRAPTRRELEELRPSLEWARDAALETVRWTSTFEFPTFERPYTFFALSHPDRYAVMDGNIASTVPFEIPVSAFDDYVVEEHIEHSTALHAHLRDGGGTYMAGPMARYALNADRLLPAAAAVAREVGIENPCRNPFRSILVRGVEIVHACEEALRIIEAYEEPDRSFVEVPAKAAVGFGATEAPRGLLYHRYEIDADGLITDARIVPPTSQNQAQIESDLRAFVEGHMHLDHEVLTHTCEQAIRNYDPCISCATHFLDLSVEEAGSS